MGYWNLGSVPPQINKLAQLDYNSIAQRNHGHSSESEIAEILEVLESAHKKGRGVYVFYSE